LEIDSGKGIGTISPQDFTFTVGDWGLANPELLGSERDDVTVIRHHQRLFS
jgi:hypothetical protein